MNSSFGRRGELGMYQLASSAMTFELELDVASFNSCGVKRNGASLLLILYILRDIDDLEKFLRAKREATGIFLANAIRTKVVVSGQQVGVGPTRDFLYRQVTCYTHYDVVPGRASLATAH